MGPCSICGAAHAPAAAGEPCLAPCVRSLVARVAALESPTVRGVAFPISETTTLVGPPPPLTIPLGGSAGGAGGMK